MQKNTDWNLVVQAQIAIGWIFESETSEDPHLKAAVDNYRRKCEKCQLINVGLLMAYAYIVFVYPRETAIAGIDESKLDFSAFNVSIGKISVRRIRNAIAHGRFSVSQDARITFEDNNPGKTPRFQATISAGDFGSFLQSFVNLAKDTYFQNATSAKQP